MNPLDRNSEHGIGAKRVGPVLFCVRAPIGNEGGKHEQADGEDVGTSSRGRKLRRRDDASGDGAVFRQASLEGRGGGENQSCVLGGSSTFVGSPPSPIVSRN